MTFHAADAGTLESEWSECDWLRDAPELGPLTADSMVILAAHPDDETLGAGGLLAQAAGSGIDIYVIIASDGAASHPYSATHTPQDLARRRKHEAVQALLDLAPDATVEFLDLPDGHLTEYEAAIEKAVEGACRDVALLISVWARDGHPDHEACGRVARRVVARKRSVSLLEYPIWAWHWGRPATSFAVGDPEVRGVARLTLDQATRERKQAAVAHYVSQISPLSDRSGDEVVLTASTLEYFARDCECFLTVRPADG